MITRGSVRRKSKEVFQEVIKLRKKGHSYSEIRKETGIAKSTINNWLTFAGLTLSKEHLLIQKKKHLENHVLATKASRITRSNRKDQEIDMFIQLNTKNLDDPLFITGIMLYEAEGTKGNSNGFSNSDHRLIKVFIKFLEKYFPINNDSIGYRLYIHETRKDDLERLKNYWAKKLNINKNIIRISWKHNTVTKKRANLDYIGQLQLNVRGIKHFTSKLLSISDIILSQYQK